MDVAAVARNRCIELGIYSTRVQFKKIQLIGLLIPLKPFRQSRCREQVYREPGIYNFDVNPVTCKSRAILTRIIRSPYMTNADSGHFDSPVERCLFKDVAGVSGNRCIKHSSSSTVVDWQTTVGIFFQDPHISKNIFRFPASPAINDTLSTYRPMSGTGSLNSVEIRCAVPEIFACKRKRVRSCRRGRSQKDDHILTFDPNEFGVHEPNSAEIGLAVFEKRSYRRTRRQTPLLYIYRQAPMPRLRPGDNTCQVLLLSTS